MKAQGVAGRRAKTSWDLCIQESCMANAPKRDLASSRNPAVACILNPNHLNPYLNPKSP